MFTRRRRRIMLAPAPAPAPAAVTGSLCLALCVVLLSACSSTPVAAKSSTSSGFVRSGTSSLAAPRSSGGALAGLHPLTGAFLAPGSNPKVLPGPLLIADEDNNRLVIVDPRGRTLWMFPRPGDLAPGQTFVRPDDVFFTPDGTQIVAQNSQGYHRGGVWTRGQRPARV